jgi:hypothetical protein
MSTESQSLGDTGDLGRGPGILAGTWVCTILCIIAVSIRVHVRKKLLGLDDYLIVFVVVSLNVTYTYCFPFQAPSRDFI